MTIAELREAVHDVWAYRLLELDGQPFRVGTLVLSALLLAVGYASSRRASRALRRLVVRRLHVEEGAAAAVETLGFYALFAAVVLTGLHLVHFPLEAFTLFGGALAIGVGFGSQNVMNNFISGLILMLERPVRRGDLVDIDGVSGHVVHIGTRSTLIRASDNTDLILPNSFFLEHTVVNFTLSDDVLRSQVNVSVAYGSPTRRVATLIREALDEHPAVLPSPEPRILFAEFGNDGLQFEAYFWQRTRAILDRRTIESEVRHRIDDRFREAGIVVAFPQRDVHVDAARPLDVRLVARPVDESETS